MSQYVRVHDETFSRGRVQRSIGPDGGGLTSYTTSLIDLRTAPQRAPLGPGENSISSARDRACYALMCVLATSSFRGREGRAKGSPKLVKGKFFSLCRRLLHGRQPRPAARY